MPPVGAYVRAFRTTSERTTASRHSPPYAQGSVQSFQNVSVSSRATSGSIASGASSCEGNQVRTNGMRSPARTVKSETVVRFSPRVSTGVRTQRPSGPATASSAPSSIRRTHGTISP